MRKTSRQLAVDLRRQKITIAGVAKLSGLRRLRQLRSTQRGEEPAGAVPTVECDRLEVRQLSPIAEQVEAEAPTEIANVPPAEQMEAEAPTVTATLSPAEQMEVEAAAGTASGPAELADAEATVGVADCMEEQIKTPVSVMQPHVTHATAQQGLEQVPRMQQSISPTQAGCVHLLHNRSLVSIASNQAELRFVALWFHCLRLCVQVIRGC